MAGRGGLGLTSTTSRQIWWAMLQGVQRVVRELDTEADNILQCFFNTKIKVPLKLQFDQIRSEFNCIINSTQEQTIN